MGIGAPPAQVGAAQQKAVNCRSLGAAESFIPNAAAATHALLNITLTAVQRR